MLRANTQENNDQMANSNQSNMQCWPVFTESKSLGDNSNQWMDYGRLYYIIGIIDNQKLKPYITITVTVIMIVLHEHIVTLLKGEFFN